MAFIFAATLYDYMRLLPRDMPRFCRRYYRRFMADDATFTHTCRRYYLRH